MAQPLSAAFLRYQAGSGWSGCPLSDTCPREMCPVQNGHGHGNRADQVARLPFPFSAVQVLSPAANPLEAAQICARVSASLFGRPVRSTPTRTKEDPDRCLLRLIRGAALSADNRIRHRVIPPHAAASQVAASACATPKRRVGSSSTWPLTLMRDPMLRCSQRPAVVRCFA